MKHPEAFYEFYKEKMMFLDAEPNPAHQKLARLKQQEAGAAVITQNIDGLHQKAGSERVAGTAWKYLTEIIAKRCGSL